MIYYLIGSDQQRLQAFQKRLPTLKDAIVVKNGDELEKHLETLTPDSCFFILSDKSTPEIDQMILLIKTLTEEDSTVIFATTSPSFMPNGGDIYISQDISENDLKTVLKSKLTELSSHNKLGSMIHNPFKDFTGLITIKAHKRSMEIDRLFKAVIPEEAKIPKTPSNLKLAENTSGVDMSGDKDDLVFNDVEEIELSLTEEVAPAVPAAEAGLDLNLEEDLNFELSEEGETKTTEDSFGDLSLDEKEESLSLTETDSLDDFSLSEPTSVKSTSTDLQALDDLDLSDTGAELELGTNVDLDLGSAEVPDLSDRTRVAQIVKNDDVNEDVLLSFGDESNNSEADLSAEAKEKLKEIDAIMDFDASQVALKVHRDVLDEPLVSDDLDLGSLDFSSEDNDASEAPTRVTKVKKKEVKEVVKESRDLGQDLKEISGAYSGEMERLQATISNLRADRSELLAIIQRHEEDKVLHARQSLTLRAELDEKKIELTIMRKKLTEEVNELRDKVKMFDEKRLILEEKNKALAQEVDKLSQKNKIDVKKVMMRERELEQKLELLKTDAETQIRHRDMKILELKRKLDAMEFDMESISMQEKRSVESRFELEDKLDKAIKTLRNAITVLEDESEKSNALEALKKNIDM